MIFEMVLSDPFIHERPEYTVTKKKFSAYPFCNHCVLNLKNNITEL